MVERGTTIEPVHNHESILAREFVDTILQGARENLAAHGSSQATVFFKLDNGERGIVPISIPEFHEDKQIYFMLLGLTFFERGRRVQEAILVSESWYVGASEGDHLLHVAPSQHPQRKEAITLAGRDFQGQKYVFAIQPFTRDSCNQPIFEPIVLEQFGEQPDDNNYSTGLLDHIFLGVNNIPFC